METSGRQIQKIRCPGCGKEHDFAIWNSINTALEPELKEKVMNGSLFRTVCPHCGQAIDVVYPCLYHQVEEKRMIYYAPGEDAMREAQAAFSEGTAASASATFASISDSLRCVHSLSGRATFSATVSHPSKAPPWKR